MEPAKNQKQNFRWKIDHLKNASSNSNDTNLTIDGSCRMKSNERDKITSNKTPSNDYVIQSDTKQIASYLLSEVFFLNFLPFTPIMWQQYIS